MAREAQQAAHPTTTGVEVFDVVGIGLGPFNLSLACLIEPLPGVTSLFLERHGEFAWHPGMLIDDTTLQNPCLADLVSLADPTSAYSYLNYCKQQGEIYQHYINGSQFISREAYNRYCRWAAASLRNVRFRHEVVALRHDERERLYRISTRDANGQRAEFAARKLVLGVGAQPHLPACCEGPSDTWLHSAHYLQHKAALQARRSITIVGSGQSAAEVCHDLLKDAPRHGYALHWITRSPYFFQMETTRLTLEMFSPDYTDHFYGLAPEHKARVLARQDSLYKGINARLMDDIHHLIAEGRRHRSFEAHLVTGADLRACRQDPASGECTLRFWQADAATGFEHRADGLLFATGYRQAIPRFVGGIEHRLRFDAQGRWQLSRHYAADVDGCEVFVQNAGLHSHGLSNPELGLACYRNSCIIRELTGVEHYKIERAFALQSFGVPRSPRFTPLAQVPAAEVRACA